MCNAGIDKLNVIGGACLSVQNVTKKKALQSRENSRRARGSRRLRMRSLLQEEHSGNVQVGTFAWQQVSMYTHLMAGQRVWQCLRDVEAKCIRSWVSPRLSRVEQLPLVLCWPPRLVGGPDPCSSQGSIYPSQYTCYSVMWAAHQSSQHALFPFSLLKDDPAPKMNLQREALPDENLCFSSVIAVIVPG